MRRRLATSLWRSVVSVIVVAVAATGCTTAAPVIPAPIPADVAVTKILVFVIENHTLHETTDDMPRTLRVLREYGIATRFTAIRHPSLPNYLAIAGGSTFEVRDDRPPADHPITGTSVFGAAIAAGKTAAVFAEGMSENCQTANDGRYAVRHNPWAYFTDERAMCTRFDVPIGELGAAIDAGELPNVGLVVPDTCHDAHDCTLAVADRWFAVWLALVMAGPDYRSGRLAIVVTTDEDDRLHDNTVLTGVIHPSIDALTVTEPLTLFSLSALLSEVTGTEPLREAAGAPSMADAFGLEIAR